MELPKYKGWTVDFRLKQFRKAHFTRSGNPAKMEFEDFNSEKGDQLLTEMIKKNLIAREILVSLF